MFGAGMVQGFLSTHLQVLIEVDLADSVSALGVSARLCKILHTSLFFLGFLFLLFNGCGVLGIGFIGVFSFLVD